MNLIGRVFFKCEETSGGPVIKSMKMCFFKVSSTLFSLVFVRWYRMLSKKFKFRCSPSLVFHSEKLQA